MKRICLERADKIAGGSMKLTIKFKRNGSEILWEKTVLLKEVNEGSKRNGILLCDESHIT